MKTILRSLLLLCSSVLMAQLTTTEVVASGSVVLREDPNSITLKPGFWAKPGSMFTARIGYATLHWDCPIIPDKRISVTHTNANSYSPESIDPSKKLHLTYDTGGNTSRIYFANAKTGSSGLGNTKTKYSTETIKSLVYVYPNPNRGKITVSWDKSIDSLIRSVALATPNGVSIPISINTVNGIRQGNLSFSGPTGTYFLNIYLTDTRKISKIILKH